MNKRWLLAVAGCVALIAIVTLHFADARALTEVSLAEADGVAGGQHGPCGRIPEYDVWFTSGLRWCRWWFTYCSTSSEMTFQGLGTYMTNSYEACYDGCGTQCTGGIYTVKMICPSR